MPAKAQCWRAIDRSMARARGAVASKFPKWLVAMMMDDIIAK